MAGCCVGPRKEALRIVEEGRQRIIRDDFTGRVEHVNADLLRLLLAQGYTPVIAPLALADTGEAVNVDGDRAAAMVAAALEADTLVILSNVPGLLADAQDERTLVTSLCRLNMGQYEGQVSGGMRRKLIGAREALQAGVRRVVLADGRAEHPVQAGASRERNGDRMTTGFESIAEIDQDAEMRYEAVASSKRPIRLVRGEGALVYDDQGNEYIDCVGGIAVANVGHANPRVVAAITQQATRLISCPELFHNDVRAAYLERLVAALPEGLNRVFLCNSGTEAIEAAIKFARFATGRTQIDRRHARLSRAHDGRAQRHLGKSLSRALRAAGARLYPRAL